MSTTPSGTPNDPSKASTSSGSVDPESTSSGSAIQKWVDPAMFPAMPLNAEKGPTVNLTQAPSDPLGVIAQLAMAYEGRFVENLAEITDVERRRYLADMQLTKLAMPLEGVQFVFSISGVTRAFTHQMVRQRTAAYSQESMRFAVVEDEFASRVILPPSLVGAKSILAWDMEAVAEVDAIPNIHFVTDQDRSEEIDRVRDSLVERYGTQADKWRYEWDKALQAVQHAYRKNVETGQPAEDARGLLPTNIATRINYVTNLRSLLDHAGNRLCTQAQFEWRQVFAQIASAIRQYGVGKKYKVNLGTARNIRATPLGPDGKPDGGAVWDLGDGTVYIDQSSQWQFDALAKLFRPVCYQIGKCPMKASFDRACSIRNRVDANAEINRPSTTWDAEYDAVDPLEIAVGVGPKSVVRGPSGQPEFIGAIKPAEWLFDPGAAR